MRQPIIHSHVGRLFCLGAFILLGVLVQMGSFAKTDTPHASALQPAPPIVTSAADCAAYDHYAGAEPPGYAQHCLQIQPGAPTLFSPTAPTDQGFAHDIGFISDNVVQFTLNNFPGQTPLSSNAEAIFAYDYSYTGGTLYALNNTTQQLGTFNKYGGTFNPIGASVPLAGHTWTGMAINPVNGTIYASSTDVTTSTLYRLNADTGAVTMVGTITGVPGIISMAMNAQEQLYGHDIVTDSIYQIDPNTGASTLIGPTGYDATFAQGMDFDNNDGTLYIFLYIGGGANVYGTVNLATGAVTPLAQDNPLGEFEGATQTVPPSLLFQPPNAVNGYFSDPHCGWCSTGQQSMADNFTVTGFATIQRIILWGGYFPGNIANAVDDFTVNFREDAGGIPGRIIASEKSVPLTRKQTGNVIFGVNEYEYTLTLILPISLPPGSYWLEIFNDTFGNSDSFFWETGELDSVHGVADSAYSLQVAGGSWVAQADNGLAVYMPPATIPAPAHDLFVNAHMVSALPFNHEVNVSAATVSGNDPNYSCGSMNQGGGTVWYRYTAVSNTPLVVHTQGSRYDTMLAVWQGTAGNLTNIACDDDAEGTNFQSEIKFVARAGQTYYFEVAAYGSNNSGNLMFSIVEGDEWLYRGPERPSPSINELTIDPENPNVVYAATTEGVYKSTNGGDTWVAKLNGLGTFGGLEVTNLVIHPTDSDTLYISTWGDGVYKSTNGGDSWVLQPSPITAQAALQSTSEMDEWIHAGGQALVTPDLLPGLLETAPEASGVGSAQGVIDKQTLLKGDSSLLFAPDVPTVPQPIHWAPANNLAIHPDNPDRVIVALFNNYGFFISENGGSSWAPLIMPSATITSGQAIAFAPSNANIAYASTGHGGANGGIFRSNDGGQTWSLTADSGSVATTVMHFAIDPNNPNRVLAATIGGGVVATVDGGANWDPSDAGMAGNEIALLNIEMFPENSNIVYATGYLWIWKSINGGASWAIADTSYLDFYTSGLAVHPTSSNIVYAGARQAYIGTGYYRGGVHKTTNGATFSQQTNGLEKSYVLDMEPDPNNPMNVYAGTWGSGIFKSDDGGVTWAQANAGLDLPFVYSLEATTGPAGTVLYAGTFYSDRGLFVSYNQGASWQPLPPNLPDGLALNVFDIESADGSHDNLVIATGNGIYRSSDGGQNWTWGQVSGANTVNIMLDVERASGLSNRLLAATYGDGIYYSTDGGFNWTPSTGEPSTIVFGLSASPDIAQVTHIYAANAGTSTFTGGTAVAGLSRSVDGGVTWQAVNDPALVGVSFRSVDHAREGTGDVFAGSVGQGMWVSPDFSSRWFRMSQGFTPPRVRSVDANFALPDKVFVGTDGQGAWWLHMVNSPTLHTIYLPSMTKP